MHLSSGRLLIRMGGGGGGGTLRGRGCSHHLFGLECAAASEGALGAFPARGTTESEQSESSVKRPIPQLLYSVFFNPN